MSATISISMHCDNCHASMPSSRTTSRGARGDAERIGWAVAYQADPRAGASNDPQRRDLCPDCRPDRPRNPMAAWEGCGES